MKGNMNCKFEGCDRIVKVAKYQLCSGHYTQMKEGRPLAPLRRRAANARYKGQACNVVGCNIIATIRDMCQSHDWQHKQYGITWPLGQDNPMTTINDSFSTDRYCKVCHQTKHWTKYHLNVGMCTDCYRVSLSRRVDVIDSKPKKGGSMQDLLDFLNATLSDSTP